MSPLDTVAGPVAESVAEARPSAVFPLASLGQSQRLRVHNVEASFHLPPGVLASSSPLATLSVSDFLPQLGRIEIAAEPTGATATVAVDRDTLTLSVVPPLLVHSLLPDVEYKAATLSYDFRSRTAACPLTVVSPTLGIPLMPATSFGELLALAHARQQPQPKPVDSDVSGKVAAAFVEAIGTTAMGKPGYSLFTDPAPVETVAAAIANLAARPSPSSGLVPFFNRIGANGFAAALAQTKTDVVTGLVPTPEIGPELVRLQEVRVGFSSTETQNFSSTEVQNIPSEKGTNEGLRLIEGERLNMTAHLDVDLATVSDAVSGSRGVLATAIAVAPRLGVRKVEVTGRVGVVQDDVVVAFFNRVQVGPDATVTVSEVELTEAGEKMVEMMAQVGGVNLLGMDKSAGSIGAVLAEGAALKELVGSWAGAVDLARTRPEEIMRLMAAAAVKGHRSNFIEPAVRSFIATNVEAPVQKRLNKFLKEYVEQPLGVTLPELLGRQPRIIVP